MTDLSIFITVAGLCLSVATFYFGRQSVTKADGKAAGALETDLRYIKESVGRIEGQLNRDVQRLEGRIDEISSSPELATPPAEPMSQPKARTTALTSTSNASTTYRRIGGDQMRKPRKEFSKTILRAVAAATVVIVVFSFALMWRTGDTSPLAYIIPGIFTELSAATGFYFWKAKAENEIKLDTIRRQKELEQSKKQNTEPGEYDPGSNYEGGTP